LTEKDFDELDYSEYNFRLGMLAEEKAEALKKQMIAASFTAWQMKETNKTFEEYLRILGLTDKQEKIPDATKKKMIERNINIAERIRKGSLKQRNKN